MVIKFNLIKFSSLEFIYEYRTKDKENGFEREKQMNKKKRNRKRVNLMQKTNIELDVRP